MRAFFPALLAVFTLSLTSFATEPAADLGGASPLTWSKKFAEAEMARRGDTLFAGGAGGKARWDYANSLLGLALVRLGEKTGHTEYKEFGAKTAESFVGKGGAIATYKPEEFSLDSVAPGKVLLARWEQGNREPAVRTALAALREQLVRQPRTSDGGFWHKQRYPSQMWLDGLYMAAPFLVAYGEDFAEPGAIDEAVRQLLLADTHTYDPSAGLWRHGWDEKKAQAWADKATGMSPSCWSRAIGWYGMALVDSLDRLPAGSPAAAKLVPVLRRLADGLVRWQDPASGLWWQVTDQGARAGNYREASASAMFVYTLAKGVNRGWLPREKFSPAAKRGYAGIVRELVRTDAAGRPSLTHCCEVAGLGFTNAKGRARDGSFDYYVSEPVVDNDQKAVGPFILAGLEMQQLVGAARVADIQTDADDPAAAIRAPEFPRRDFPITNYGANPGTDVTAAIREAIAACHAAGGGRVVVPAGEWLTGAIRLRSNVNLHVAQDATLKFSTDPAAYPNVFTRWEGVECLNYSPLIYALDEENIAVTGEGTLDGQAAEGNWWGWTKRGSARDRADRDLLNDLGERGVPVAQRVFGAGHFLRPNFLQPYRCRNVLIEGVTIVRSPMWEIHPVLCTNVTVHDVTIHSHGPNNDGCDPESSRDVLIAGCTFDTGDDCIAIKSGRNNDGRRIGVASENLVIRNCVMQDGHGGVVLGSECSGGIRNVLVEDCTMDSPELDRALRLKSNAMRGGVLENILFRRVRIGRVREAVLTIDLLYEEGARGDHPPVVRNIRLDHVTSTASPRVLWIAGFPGATIDGIRLSDCTFRGVETAEVVSGAGRIELDRVTIEPLERKASRNSRPADSPSTPIKS
jgi:unsaturated rhamnogalacturonyl hydrolase